MPFAKLNPIMIVDQALELFYAEGLAGVSIRRIADALEVNVASLYWHVKNRDALYGQLVERIFRKCLVGIPEVPSWQEWLRCFGVVIWKAQASHPDMRTLILIAKPDVDVRDAVNEDINQCLRERGLDRMQAGIAQHSVQALVTGWSILNAENVGADRARFVRSLDVMISAWEAEFGLSADP